MDISLYRNAKVELLEHIENRDVEYVHIEYEGDEESKTISGSLQEVLPQLDFKYYYSYGHQYIQGNIWYTDGTWSEREEYDGSEWWNDGLEWWENKSRPEIPKLKTEV